MYFRGGLSADDDLLFQEMPGSQPYKFIHLNHSAHTAFLGDESGRTLYRPALELPLFPALRAMDPHVEQHQSYGLDGWTAKSAYAAHQLWRAKLSSGTDLSTDPRSGHKVDPPPQPPTSPKTRRRTTRLPHAKGSPSLPKDSRASAQHASSSTKNDGKAWADWMLEPKGVAQVVQSIGEALGCIALRPKAQPASAAQTARAEDAIRILQCCGVCATSPTRAHTCLVPEHDVLNCASLRVRRPRAQKARRATHWRRSPALSDRCRRRRVGRVCHRWQT
jgi:hypothetical protein